MDLLVKLILLLQDFINVAGNLTGSTRFSLLIITNNNLYRQLHIDTCLHLSIRVFLDPTVSELNTF